MILGVDFDNTLVISKYPDIIGPNIPVIEYVNYKHECGYTIIICTCRHSKENIEAVKDACKKYGIHYDYINENDPKRVEQFGESRKIGVDEYIDDTCKVTVNQIVEAYERYGENEFISEIENSIRKSDYHTVFSYVNSINKPENVLTIYSNLIKYDINYFDLIAILDDLMKQNKILCIVSNIDDTYKFRSILQLPDGYNACGKISADTFISLISQQKAYTAELN